jgi:hypothetical protein
VAERTLELNTSASVGNKKSSFGCFSSNHGNAVDLEVRLDHLCAPVGIQRYRCLNSAGTDQSIQSIPPITSIEDFLSKILFGKKENRVHFLVGDKSLVCVP